MCPCFRVIFIGLGFTILYVTSLMVLMNFSISMIHFFVSSSVILLSLSENLRFIVRNSFSISVSNWRMWVIESGAPGFLFCMYNCEFGRTRFARVNYVFISSTQLIERCMLNLRLACLDKNMPFTSDYLVCIGHKKDQR